MEYADGTGVMLSFDPLRKLQEIKDSTGTTKIENDEYGRILSVMLFSTLNDAPFFTLNGTVSA